jgi:competence protein ComEA
MNTKNVLTALALAGLMAGPVLAQIPQLSTPSIPSLTPPSAPALPTAPAMPSATLPTPTAPVTTTTTAPAMRKTNLNTATAAELDALPDVGKARGKAILDERAKGKYKDWADFEKRMANTSVNKSVLAKIQDRVSF